MIYAKGKDIEAHRGYLEMKARLRLALRNGFCFVTDFAQSYKFTLFHWLVCASVPDVIFPNADSAWISFQCTHRCISAF